MDDPLCDSVPYRSKYLCSTLSAVVSIPYFHIGTLALLLLPPLAFKVCAVVRLKPNVDDAIAFDQSTRRTNRKPIVLNLSVFLALYLDAARK